MNDSRSYITLDFRNAHMPVVVKAKRGDTARTLYISLADGGTPYVIADGCNATFTAKKPDKTVINNDCSIESNMIVYPFTEQTCSAAGRMTAEIKLYGSNGKLLTSASFTLEVYRTVVGEDDIPASESEMNTLDKLILETTALKEEVERKLENGDFQGPAPVKGIDYWTPDDKAEIMAEISANVKVLSDEEIEMLNNLLMAGTPVCDPTIEATWERYTTSSGYTWRINATIKDIDRSLIQKVEVGFGATRVNGETVYNYAEVEPTYGEVEHTVYKSYSSNMSGAYGQYGFAVRMSYLTMFGSSETMIVEAVNE